MASCFDDTQAHVLFGRFADAISAVVMSGAVEPVERSP
jgi:hypothetical protein